MILKPGLYELLVDAGVEELLREHSSDSILREAVDAGERYDVLSTYLHQEIARVLRKCSGPDQFTRQLEIANRVIEVLKDASDVKLYPFHDTNRLLEVREPLATSLPRPDTPLSRSCLLARTKLDPTLASQIKKEIVSASRIDIICSFIKWSGLRCIMDELEAFAHTQGRALRVITTSYMGATDQKAVEFLRKLPHTEVKVSYDRDRTRLHAKAFIFHRRTGFGTAYVGSANLSSAALTEGLEWNVKISQYESAHLWEKLTASFETHWHDGEFALYQEGDEGKLAEALREANGSYSSDDNMPVFDLKPYPFQQEILDRIAYERYAGRTQHLIVAATGTGKTIIGAFDYRNYAEAVGGPYPKLLFIAHREEILKQSLLTFRFVLRDMNFGELFVGDHRPQSFSHLFMSIQSFHAGEFWNTIPADYFDYFVVDEFHHAEAPTYRHLLDYFTPRSLLGLTATPERADGRDVFYRFGGHITAEIRLPDAINRKLLCPFQYFGITDSVDLSDLRWQRGGYLKDELEHLYTGNDLRAAMVIRKVKELLLDVRKAKGLGFCVSVEHARFMATKFQRAGIPAVALTGESDRQTRNTVQQRLRRGEINFIFTVDLYNEGVDIPEIDTVIFLRPSESLTIFLQQLGRGLRYTPTKECLTVLDFIGQAHRNYRFDCRYRALLDDPSRAIQRQVEEDFPHLPAGCIVQLERLAKEYVLNNIRQSLRGAKSRLIEMVNEDKELLGEAPSLIEFLERHQLQPEDIYRRQVSWSRLCVDAGLSPRFSDPDEERITKGLRRVEHISGPRQIAFLLDVLSPTSSISSPHEFTEEQRRWLIMSHFSIFGSKESMANEDEVLVRLRNNPVMCAELRELLEYCQGHIDTPPHSLALPFSCPLELHAAYTRDELLAGLGYWTLAKQQDMREGVLHLPDLNADLFLITLHKTETDYSPTTMYEDYAISDLLFHWQSQSTASVDSPTGRRYQEHKHRGHTILLCVREYKSVNDISAPYYFLGPAEYVSHTGSKPMSIIWRLQYRLPAVLMRRTMRAANG